MATLKRKQKHTITFLCFFWTKNGRQSIAIVHTSQMKHLPLGGMGTGKNACRTLQSTRQHRPVNSLILRLSHESEGAWLSNMLASPDEENFHEWESKWFKSARLYFLSEPEWYFIIISFLFGWPMVLLTPPFYPHQPYLNSLLYSCLLTRIEKEYRSCTISIFID